MHNRQKILSALITGLLLVVPAGLLSAQIKGGETAPGSKRDAEALKSDTLCYLSVDLSACNKCEEALAGALAKVPGVYHVAVRVKKDEIIVTYDGEKATEKDFVKALASQKYIATPKKTEKLKKQPKPGKPRTEKPEKK